MSGVSLQRDIGAYLKFKANPPVDVDAAGTINGAAIDRRGYESCVLFAATGDLGGSPSAQSLDAKLQDSADGSTDWTDITGAAVTQIVAADTEARVDVNLIGVRRYIRVVRVAAFTGGITPTFDAATLVVLGGADKVVAA